MAREYTISAGGITLANQPVTLVGFLPAAAPSSNIEILRAWVGQSSAAASAQQRVQLVTQVSAYPTVVTATPVPHKHNDGASILVGVGGALTAGKCGINASAEGAGAKTVKIDDVFNILNGWVWQATPKETIVIPAGSASSFGLFLPVAPGTLTPWSFGITFAEIG